MVKIKMSIKEAKELFNKSIESCIDDNYEYIDLIKLEKEKEHLGKFLLSELGTKLLYNDPLTDQNENKESIYSDGIIFKRYSKGDEVFNFKLPTFGLISKFGEYYNFKALAYMVYYGESSNKCDLYYAMTSIYKLLTEITNYKEYILKKYIDCFALRVGGEGLVLLSKQNKELPLNFFIKGEDLMPLINGILYQVIEENKSKIEIHPDEIEIKIPLEGKLSFIYNSDYLLFNFNLIKYNEEESFIDIKSLYNFLKELSMVNEPCEIKSLLFSSGIDFYDYLSDNVTKITRNVTKITREVDIQLPQATLIKLSDLNNLIEFINKLMDKYNK